MKELIYTAIFVVLGILLILLLVFMFLPKENAKETSSAATYIPGVYTSSVVLNNNTIEIEAVVDENNINSIRLVNVSEMVTTMFPLIEPSFDDIVAQIYEKQSVEDITYKDDNKYTSILLLNAIDAALDKAKVEIFSEANP